MSESRSPAETIEHIRKRSAMYVGGKDLFGFINYLVCPFNMLFARKARRIDISLQGGKFEIQSDVSIILEKTLAGISPFEVFDQTFGRGFEGPVFTALSRDLTVSTMIGNQRIIVTYQKGKQLSEEVQLHDEQHYGTKFTFVPDSNFFTNTQISEFIFDSYFRRNCHLFPGVRISFSVGGTTNEYYSENGLSDLFRSFSAPFQIMHEPIHIQVSTGLIQFELLFAFHSWRENWIVPFINYGRAVEGGSHETALLKAIDDIATQLKLPNKANGVIAVISIVYPNVTYEGCIKNKVANNTLYGLVRRHVVTETMAWIDHHPEVAEQISRLQIFQFPHAWSQ